MFINIYYKTPIALPTLKYVSFYPLQLTHFVMIKELKYCESVGQTLVVTESVKNKSREFIKKYMAKYGDVYIRPKNDPEFRELPAITKHE